MITRYIPFPDRRSYEFETIAYPAGEHQIRITDMSLKTVDRVVVEARITEQSHIIDLMLLYDALFGLNTRMDVDLHIPYLPFSRADRRFCEGDCHGLAVFAHLLRIFDTIRTLDAHSVAASELIPKMINVTPIPLVGRAVSHFKAKFGVEPLLLFPDKGAADRYGKLNLTGLFATKKRNPVTGKLEGFEVPETDMPLLVIDDICDGGGTFVGIAKELRKTNSKPVGLYVSHGIFSKGYDVLSGGLFDQLYTTNSFLQRPNESTIPVEVYDAFMCLSSVL